jgi:hypothetical protein
MNSDPMIEAVIRERRQRNILVVAAVTGILLSVLSGMAFTFDLLGDWTHGASTVGNPAGFIFFIAPFAVCMGIGTVIFKVVRRSE